MRRLSNWFERYLGWFFVNGNKQEQWSKYIFDKYEKRKTIYNKENNSGNTHSSHSK